MSKENKSFEIGDEVVVEIPKGYFLVNKSDYENKVFTITDILIIDRKVTYQIQEHPSYSYRMESDWLAHA